MPHLPLEKASASLQVLARVSVSGAEEAQQEQAPGWQSDTAPCSPAGEAGCQTQPLEVRAAKAQVKQGPYL